LFTTITFAHYSSETTFRRLKRFLIMRTILSFLLLSVSGAFGQTTYNCDAKMCELFFNLDLDSSKAVLEQQIQKIPDFHFITNDRIDTLSLTTGIYVTLQLATIPGMPCFYSARTSTDQFQPDSLKIFLGGGSGIMMMSHNGAYEYNPQNSKSYTLETVEIIRDFSDKKSATAAYESIFKTINQMCNLDLDVRETKDDGKVYWSFPISITEEEATIYQEKRVHLDFYPPSESDDVYTVKLSYSKSIWNSDSIE